MGLLDKLKKKSGAGGVDPNSDTNTQADKDNARFDAMVKGRKTFTSKPEDVAKGGGSLLDFNESYQDREFGSETPGESSQFNRREINRQMHENKRIKSAARARYRYLRRHPKKGDAAKFLLDMKAEGVNWGGTMLAGEAANEADKSITQKRIHEIADGTRKLDPGGDYFQRNLKQRDVDDELEKRKNAKGEIVPPKDKDEEEKEDDPQDKPREGVGDDNLDEGEKLKDIKDTPTLKDIANEHMGPVDTPLLKAQDEKGLAGGGDGGSGGGSGDEQDAKVDLTGKPGGGPPLGEIAKGEAGEGAGEGADEGVAGDAAGDAAGKGVAGKGAAGEKNPWVALIEETENKQVDRINEVMGGRREDHPSWWNNDSLKEKDKLALRKKLLKISEGIKEDPNFFRDNKQHIKTLFKALGIDDDKGKNVLRQHNKFQQVHKPDPKSTAYIDKYRVNSNDPWPAFSEGLRRLSDNGWRSSTEGLQEEIGGGRYKGGLTNEQFLGNAERASKMDYGDEAVNETVAAVRGMLMKARWNKGPVTNKDGKAVERYDVSLHRTTNDYAVQFQADLAEKMTSYLRLKKFGLDKNIPPENLPGMKKRLRNWSIKPPPTEKEMKKNPGALGDWIASVDRAKADHDHQSKLFKQGKIPGQVAKHLPTKLSVADPRLKKDPKKDPKKVPKEVPKKVPKVDPKKVPKVDPPKVPGPWI